jgi:hypothetical protein
MNGPQITAARLKRALPGKACIASHYCGTSFQHALYRLMRNLLKIPSRAAGVNGGGRSDCTTTIAQSAKESKMPVPGLALAESNYKIRYSWVLLGICGPGHPGLAPRDIFSCPCGVVIAGSKVEDGCPRFAAAYLGRKRRAKPTTAFALSTSKSRAGARKSNRNISFSAQVRFGEPGFPVTQHQTRPRVRLSVRKAACSPSTRPNSTGNPGNLGHPSLTFDPAMTQTPAGLVAKTSIGGLQPGRVEKGEY